MPGSRDANAHAGALPSYYGSCLVQYIRNSGGRHTAERLMVLSAIENFKGRFCVDDILQAVNDNGMNLSRGTVVNTITLMKEASLLLEVGQLKRRIYYQLAPKEARKNRTTRMPFTITLQCTKCGNLKNVRDRSAVAALASRHYTAFTPHGGVVTVFGLCSKCMDTKSLQKNTIK